MSLWEWLLVRQSKLQWTRGQGLVEYAFILIFVAVVMIALLVILGPGIRNIYQSLVDQFNAI